MKEENKSSLEIKSEAAATLLLNNKTRWLISPFVGEKKSVKEASEQMGMKLASYYVYVKRFERAGLIEVVEVQPRAGRAIKLYKTVADEFFIPHTVSPLLAYYEKLEDDYQKLLWQGILKALEAGSEAMGAWGFKLYKHPKAGLAITGARSQDEEWDLLAEKSAILPYWRRLKLSREKAKALQHELHEVLDRYIVEQDELDDYSYLVRVAMAPLPAP